MTDARDIVERLRAWAAFQVNTFMHHSNAEMADEAADTIATLRKQLEDAREALRKLLNYMPEHDDWCSIGALHNCTCNSRPLKEEARAALRGMS